MVSRRSAESKGQSIADALVITLSELFKTVEKRVDGVSKHPVK
jgi:hypothetical protein